MSTESNRIRQKFRHQIRNRQIADMMRMYRMKSINENSNQTNIFLEMNKKMINAAKMPTDLSMVWEIITIMEKYPQNDDTYVLIGNYLIQHSCAYPYFEMRLLGVSEIAKKLKSYRWALTILLSKIEEVKEKVLAEYDQTMSEILQVAKTEEDLIECLDILRVIFTMQNLSNETKYFPQKFIIKFFDKITETDLKTRKLDIKYNIVNVMYRIAEDHLDHRLIKEYIPEIVKILIVGISQFPVFRPDFILCLKRLAYDYFDEIEDLLRKQTGREMLGQIMYIYDNVITERNSILLIFECLIRETSFEIFLNLLAQGLHISLVSTFNHQDPQHLRMGLNVILQIFNRLQERQQIKILDRVIDSMDQIGLHNYLAQLANVRQDPSVEKALTQLLDDYFSQEVA